MAAFRQAQFKWLLLRPEPIRLPRVGRTKRSFLAAEPWAPSPLRQRKEILIAGSPQWCSPHRSEEHTSELQSLMRISYAVFCLKKQNTITHTPQTIHGTTQHKT